MARIPRAALDYVTGQVNGLSADAQAKVLKVLESIEWTPGNIAECRDLVIQALQSVLPTYTDAAAQAGADLFDAVREVSVGEALGAQAVSGYDPDAVSGAVRAIVQDIVDEKPVEQFNRKVLDRIDYEVRRAENVSVAENAARDPLGPKYARVPTGAETCEFCIMLASRGFVYSTAEAASHAHAGCDCRVVQGYDGMDVDGYDPDEYYLRWKDGVVREEESITKRMNREWTEFKKAETEESYFQTVGKYIRSFSDDGRIECEYRTKPLAKELMTARSLAKSGHSVVFRREVGGAGKNPDSYVDGEVCEFKRITSSNKSKIYQRLEDSDQAEFYVVDLRISKITEEDAMDVARHAVESGNVRAEKVLLLFSDDSEVLIE